MYLARSSPTVLTWFMDASLSDLQHPHSGTPRPPGAFTPSRPVTLVSQSSSAFAALHKDGVIGYGSIMTSRMHSRPKSPKFSGPPRVRYEPSTVEEAVTAAQDLAADREQQVAIAAGLI